MESSEHALRDCPKIASVWERLPYGNVENMNHVLLAEWVGGVMLGLGTMERPRFASILWALWYARNACVFQNFSMSPDKIVEMAWKNVDDYMAAKILRPDVPNRSEGERWKPPSPGTKKLNVDAACKQGFGTGLGVVLRDATGHVQWVMAQTINESLSVDVAEAQTICYGMRKAMEMGEPDIVVEMDSQVAFCALRRPKEDISYFGGIITEIRSMCNNFESCDFNWVRRKANKVAQELAHFAYSCDTSYFSFSAPEVIMYVVEADFPAI